MNDLRTAAQQALAFTTRDFATVRDFEAARAALHDTLKAALEQLSPDPADEYRKGFIDGQIDMRDRPEEQPEQAEPEAWLYRHKTAPWKQVTVVQRMGHLRGSDEWHEVPIYTRPPRRETEQPNFLGWSFRRNGDGSIGIKSPPPKPGESKRTGESVYPTDGGGLHELLSKFVDHIATLERPEQCSCGDRHKDQCPGEWEPGCDLGSNPRYARRVPLEQPEQAALEQPEPDAIEQALAHAEAFSRGHDTGWQSAIAHRAALEQQEQEPVDAEAALRLALAQRDWAFKQLQAQPDRREWRGLSEEERADILFPLTAAGASDMECARAVEAKLKEKNHE